MQVWLCECLKPRCPISQTSLVDSELRSTVSQPHRQGQIGGHENLQSVDNAERQSCGAIVVNLRVATA